MKKRILSVLLAFVIASAVLPVAPMTAAAAWNGTEKAEPVVADGVYQIGNGAELAWFADYVNALGAEDKGLVDVDAVLTDDIDLGGMPWTPIGLITYVVDAYAGTFDGQNHTVSGLNIDASASNYGLFAIVNTGTVKNLKVEGNVTSNNVVGGIIGKLQTGNVENCSMRGSVTSTGASTRGYAGGIIGTVSSNNAVITGCCNTADISGTYAGGIIGYSSNTVHISSCYNTGDIAGTSRSAGIAGQLSKGSISYCYNIGASKNGICGFSNATITNCYYLNDEEEASGGSASGYEKITDKTALLNGLNSGTQALFSEDKAGVNNGYPVLIWQLSSEVKAVPVEKAEITGEAVTGEVLTARAFGEKNESATNVSYQWSVSDDNVSYTDIAEATKSTFAIPDTNEYFNKYIGITVSGENGSEAFSSIGPVLKSDDLVNRENTEKVQEALASLSLETTVIKEATVLNLVSQIGECSAVWESSNPDVIRNNGAVTLPEKNIVSVTLTAYVSCGNVTKSRQFSVDVWAKNVDAEVYLQNVLDDMKWNFRLLQPVFGKDTNIIIKFKNILNNMGYDGVTVTVKSTEDESLVSQSGKITYPALEQGNYANGRQVRVSFNLTVDDKTVVYPTENIYSLLIPWDTSVVRTSLEKSADSVLADEVILGANNGFDSVADDLILPSCIRGDKYSFAWIEWNSSDTEHLEISNENRQSGADSLYNPYLGRVHQDSEPHTVVLTAVITNPSTDITVTRDFEVTIEPLSQEKLEQSLSSMSAILDCYTADKLTDFVTKQRLDTASVENDIQLVIPKNVVTSDELRSLGYGKYWDYWNYRFTVSSSNTDVIEINSFRAYVYRPLGEDASADERVTLTVKMESKDNPNLFVTREITVTVKHLSREEINAALDLMDRAKTGYSSGLLGGNTDKYSIIDNLTPYREIVWNSDKSDIEFVYSSNDEKNDGIIVDELPGWEEQEDWRLFRTSDRNLLANETLILNKTPDSDTFVKINSVLTDEVFGKYYTKFINSQSYDAEALAKFRQLYKQPVSAYVLVVGKNNYTASFAAMAGDEKASLYSSALASFKQQLDKPISVSFTLLGLDGISLISKTQVNSFTSGATVFDVFKKVLTDNAIPYTARGSYITSVNGLAEFDHGRNSGWMYTVGKVFVNSYMNAQELYGGEDIVVMYVNDYSLANKYIADVPDSGAEIETQNSDNAGENGSDTQNASVSQPSESIRKSDHSSTEPSASSSSTAAISADGENGKPLAEIKDGETENIRTESKDEKDDGSVSQNENKTQPEVFIFIAVVLVILVALLLVMLKKRSKEKINTQ